MKTYWVTVRRGWNGSRYDPILNVTNVAAPLPNLTGSLYCIRVEASGAEVAKAAAMLWLAQGRPKSLLVKEEWNNLVGDHNQRSFEDM